MKRAFSWSILSSWAFYSKEEAVKQFLKIPIERDEKSEAKLREGSEVHETIEKEGLLFLDQIPAGGERELYGRADLSDWLTFSYKIDYYIPNMIVDYKTGAPKKEEKDVEQMLLQNYCYALVSEMLDKPVDKGYLIWVKRTKKEGVKYVHHVESPVGQKELQKAWDFIYPTAQEMKRYLITKNLWI